MTVTDVHHSDGVLHGHPVKLIAVKARTLQPTLAEVLASTGQSSASVRCVVPLSQVVSEAAAASTDGDVHGDASVSAPCTSTVLDCHGDSAVSYDFDSQYTHEIGADNSKRYVQTSRRVSGNSAA